MIVVLVPVLNRPQNVQPLAASLDSATSVPYRLVWLVSPDDREQEQACEDAGGETWRVDWPAGHGDFARKINLGYRLTTEPWVFQGADDIRFGDGWDLEALAVAEKTGALVVGTNDGHNPTVKAGRHSTHTLIARSYCDDPGASMDGRQTVFSEAYGHQWCDTELVELAKHRRVWAFAAASRVTHEHPFWVGRDRMDATYRKGLSTSAMDAALFKHRRKMWA